MIGEAELAVIRKVALQALPDSAQILRPTEVDDGSLGSSTELAILSSVPCRVSESRQGREVVIGGSAVSAGNVVVRLPYGTDISESDQIQVTTNGRQRSLEVLRVLEASYATVTSVECSEVR